MPEPSFFETVLKNWQGGATIVGLAAVLIVLFIYIGKPLIKWSDERTAARRQAGKEIREAEAKARESELNARVAVAECMRETTLHLATIGADMKETVAMSIKLHDAYHARLDAKGG